MLVIKNEANKGQRKPGGEGKEWEIPKSCKKKKKKIPTNYSGSLSSLTQSILLAILLGDPKRQQLAKMHWA